MKQIKTKDSIGHIICHDITRIIRGEIKDAVFRKGHIVREEDIELLLSMGKENLYVWENTPDMMHEDEAAEVLFEIFSNSSMECSDIKEGKIEFRAKFDGLFSVDLDLLEEINMEDDVIVAARHSNYPVKRGETLAGTRVIPLVIHRDKIDRVRNISNGKSLFNVFPYMGLKAAVIATGSEIYHGRIKDTFTDVVIDKMKIYDITTVYRKISDDNRQDITGAILEAKEMGVDIIICTGGMSVDPDDLTPSAIIASGASVVSYGAPVLPGAMMLLGYFEDGTTIAGLPGCVMYNSATIFDLILPRISAGIKITKRDIARLGNGGLCLKCPTCTYPDCSFGKGS